MKTKEHKESNSCKKYYRWRNALYKINFWTILKKLLQKNDFRRFPLFEIFAPYYFGWNSWRQRPHWWLWSVLCLFSHQSRDYEYFASDYSLYDSRIWQLSASSTYGFHAKSIISFLRFLYNLIIAVFRQAPGYVWCEFMYDRMILLENLENYCGIDF